MKMNWRLILGLSGFGAAMGIATVFFIPSNVEPLCWLVIFAICAFLIAKNVPARHFLHGFFVSLVNSVWITGAHVILFERYIATHAEEAAMASKLPLPARVMMLVTGPFIGAVSGLLLGLIAFVAGKFIKPPAAAK